MGSVAEGELSASFCPPLPDARGPHGALPACLLGGSLLSLLRRAVIRIAPRFASLRNRLPGDAASLEPWTSPTTYPLPVGWPGRRSGTSPYAYAPADPALSGLDPALQSRVAHPEIRTVYPPAAQPRSPSGAAASGGSREGALRGGGRGDRGAHLEARAGRRVCGGALRVSTLCDLGDGRAGPLDSLGVALTARLASSSPRPPPPRRASPSPPRCSRKRVPRRLRRSPARGPLPFADGSGLLAAALWWSAAGRPPAGVSPSSRSVGLQLPPLPGVVTVMEALHVPDRAKDHLHNGRRLGRPPWTQAVFPSSTRLLARVALAAALAIVRRGSPARPADAWSGPSRRSPRCCSSAHAPPVVSAGSPASPRRAGIRLPVPVLLRVPRVRAAPALPPEMRAAIMALEYAPSWSFSRSGCSRQARRGRAAS